VQYANSVIGARTNRNSIAIDVCSAVTGLTPEFGYLLDENRRGRMLVKLDIEKMDAPALGFILGQKVVDKVPVIEHYDFSNIELKNMGGSMAAAGGVALFHVEGLTPEAPDLKTVFDGEPETFITVTQQDLDDLRTNDPAGCDLVVFGCPQMTLEEARLLGERFAGKRVKKPTWFCLVPEAKERFEKTDLYSKVRTAGVEVHSHCPVAALTLRLGKKRVLTASAKCLYYLGGAEYGSVEDCLATSGVGS
jgi:predicted aconitase